MYSLLCFPISNSSGWGLGTGDWVIGKTIPNSQCPIPNPQSPIPNSQFPIPNPYDKPENFNC
jgi:hypothetical protein